MKRKLEKIKMLIRKNVGTVCTVNARSGRKNLCFENCVIESAYPEIFVINYADKKGSLQKKMSFSYTDLLIKKVSITAGTKNKNEKGA